MLMNKWIMTLENIWQHHQFELIFGVFVGLNRPPSDQMDFTGRYNCEGRFYEERLQFPLHYKNLPLIKSVAI